jgi:hypothetical protein
MAKEAAMTPEQRRARDKDQVQKQAAGCLLILLIILVVILFAIFHPRGGGAAQAILAKIPGCTNISTSDGDSYHDNTIAEGSCDLPNYASLKIYVWAAGDDLDLHDWVYWYSSCTPSTGFSGGTVTDGCFVGSNPTPWFIDVESVVPSDWTPVENALHVTHIPKPPYSWCSFNCIPPGTPSGGGGFGFGGGDDH